MRTLIAIATLALSFTAHAEKMVDFEFKGKDVLAMIEQYSTLSGKKFVIDPSVRGKADILPQGKVSLDEAYALMSTALAVNGIAISEQEGTLVVQPARNIQRSLLQVTSELPALKPERMVTYVYTPKFLTADTINKNLRILASKDGEIIPVGNKMIFTDWVTNIHRIYQTLALIDRSDTKMTPPKVVGKKAKSPTQDEESVQ
jgi:type II secretory pathway component GspD/PulD (secretin)